MTKREIEKQTRIYYAMLTFAGVSILIAAMLLLYAGLQPPHRPFYYIGERDQHSVVIYEAQNPHLCPGDDLRYKISVTVTEPALHVILKYKILDEYGRNIYPARFDDRTLDRAAIFTDQLRTEPLPTNIQPGRYRLVGGAVTQNTDSDLYAVPFDISPDCLQFQRK